jgi:amino acid transporter
LFLLFGCAAKREALVNIDVILAAEIAWPQKWVVYIGIILISSGSALLQIQNAPLIINSIADDCMLPRIFNHLKGPTRKPLGFTVFLIAVSLCFGSLD